MNILLTENSPGCGLQMKKELEALGHSVTWIIGATQIAEHVIVGILPSPTPVCQLFGEEKDADPNRTVEIDLAGIEFAFCDARLVGPIHDGCEAVKALVANGIICCASSMAGNPTLQKAGAQMGISKLFWILALRAGLLDPGKARADVARAARELTEFEQQKHGEMVQSRDAHQRMKSGFDVIDSLADAKS